MFGGYKIIHCAETIKGGIATYLHELLPHQVSRYGSESIAVIIPASQSQELAVPDGVDVIFYPDSNLRLFKSIQLARTVIHYSRNNFTKIVHVHSTYAGLIRPILRLILRNVIIVYCAHGWAWDRQINSCAKKIIISVEKFLEKFTDKIICISKHDYNAAMKIGLAKRKLTCIPNGLSTTIPLVEDVENVFFDSPRLHLLFIGRFDKQKGVDIFFNVLRNLEKYAVGVAAGGVVLGDEKKLDVPLNVQCVGWVNSGKLQSLLNWADALIVPSRWEGFGLVAIEAMRSAVPVIAANVGGLAEIVVNGKTGYLVRSDDTNAIIDIVRFTSNDILKTFGLAGKKRFLDFYTIDKVCDHLDAVYNL